MEDILAGYYTIDQNIEYYSMPRNIMVLRMKTIAFQSLQIAAVSFDKERKDHAMLNDLYLNDDIGKTCKKFDVTRNDLIKQFAELAYHAIDVANEAGLDKDKILEIMAWNNSLKGMSIKESMEKVKGKA